MRRSVRGAAPAYLIVNANLVSSALGRHWRLALSVNNLFDRRYSDPASNEHRQTAIAQDGRSARLNLAHVF